MATVHTLVANEGVRTGSTGAQASPNDFGAGVAKSLAPMAAGLNDTAQVISALAQQQRAEEKRMAVQLDEVWAGTRVEEERRRVVDFLADPNVSTNPRASADYMDFVNQRLETIGSDAPTPAAAQLARSRFGQTITQHYGSAVELGRKAMLNNTVTSFDARAQSALEVFKSGSDGDLLPARNQLMQDIDTSFNTSPKIAAALKEKYDLDFIYAAVDHNPDLAKQIINSSKNIDEAQRYRLHKSLFDAKERLSLTEKANFDQVRQDQRTRWDQGTSLVFHADLGRYRDVYGKELGDIKFKEDETLHRVATRAFDTYTTLADKSPMYQAQALDNMSSAIKGEEDLLVVKKVAEQISQSTRMFNHDRVAWLAENNKDVKSITERARSVGDAERPAVMAQRVDALLRFQGPAPEGVSADEAARYLNLPEGERSILSVGEAESFASRINAGSPSEALSIVDTLVANYGGEKNAVIAFNDLVRLPHGDRKVRQEYQLAIQNRGAWWLDSYMASIRNAPDVKKLSPEETRDYTKVLETNAKWTLFQRAMVGDNLQRAGELSSFKDGIMAYARSMPGSPSAAINKSVDMLLGEQLGFADIHGKPLVIPRRTSLNGPPARTDDEIKDIGRRLTVALAMIDPAKIDDHNFNVAGFEGIDRFQRVRDIVTTGAFFQPTADGQGATLYFADDMGKTFQLRDKKGRAFKILYDELPSFASKGQSLSESAIEARFPGLGGSSGTTKQQPKNTYDMFSTTGSALFGTLEHKSHWPVQPKWIRNE